MKFGLLIEYLIWETFFLKNHKQNEVDKLVWIHQTLVNLNIKTFLWYLSKNFGINMLNHSEVWFIKFYIILITVNYNITQLKLHIFITVMNFWGHTLWGHTQIATGKEWQKNLLCELGIFHTATMWSFATFQSKFIVKQQRDYKISYFLRHNSEYWYIHISFT